MLGNRKEKHAVPYLSWANHRCCVVTAVHGGSSCFRALVVLVSEGASSFSTLYHNYSIVVFNHYLWWHEIWNHKFVLIRFQKCVCVHGWDILVSTVWQCYISTHKTHNVWCVCTHACLHHDFHLQHTHWQAVPCLRSPHCCSHMPVGRRPRQPKPPEWQPYLPQTLATNTRIVNNMWVPAGGTLLLRTNKISVKSHLQTPAKYKCGHLCH